MVSCSLCPASAVFAPPAYCADHFFSYFEEKMFSTIERFQLIKDDEKIAVAVSGGKDSQTTLFLLHRLYGDRVRAIAIDEGIPGYRDDTLADLQVFCEKYSIPYQVYSFRDAFGADLKQFIRPGAAPCRSCGVLRRFLLNKYASDFDKIATGHNLDDECQSLVMNLLKGNMFMSAKLGPVSGISHREGFTQRIKPLYLCSEREVATYAFLRRFPVRFNECPHASDSFRSLVRDGLNELEVQQPGTKLRLIENFLAILPVLHEQFRESPEPLSCTQCGQPSTGKICKACQTLEEFSYVH